MNKIVWFLAVATLMWELFAAQAFAQSADNFYQSKQINIHIGFAPGGGYDLYGRLVARHIERYIPGRPQAVPRNMPGAGGLAVVNYLYHVAPKDGTALGVPSDGLVLEQMLDGKGVDYDASKLNWIGRVASVNSVFFTWHSSGITNFEDARKRETAVGIAGAGITVYMSKALKKLAGAQFKLISGFRGSREVLLAIERGEVDGGYTLWSSLKNDDWLRANKINIIFFGADKRLPDRPDVPIAAELGATKEGQQILQLLSAGEARIGRAIFTGPGVPEERVSALRQAFAQVMRDDSFKVDIQKAQLDFDPLRGEELQRIVAELLASPKELVAMAREALE